MLSRPEWIVALRYLRPNRSDRFVSVITGFSFLGIMLGVATLIVVMSVMNGFRQELFGKVLGMNAHIAVYAEKNGGMAPLGNFESLQKKLAAIDGVVSAIPVVEGQVMASHSGKTSGVLVRGLRTDDLQNKSIIANHIDAGILADVTGFDRVMIGYKLANKLGLTVGDRITLVSPQGQITAFGTVPRVKTFTIAAIFNVGMYEYDSGFVYMPLAAAQAFFNHEKTVSAIEINTEDAFQLMPIKQKMFAILPDGTNVTDWQRSHAAFFNAIQVERNVMFLILTLIIVVAAFNIVSGLVMMVKDKSASIAILRTMGATQGQVMRIFLFSGSIVGFVGTLLGLVLGIAFAANIESIRQFLQSLSGTQLFSDEIYFLSKLPAVIDWSEVLAVVLMTMVISVLATLYPSWRAARLNPVEALRYE